MKRAALALVFSSAALVTAFAAPATVRSVPGCHPTRVDATWRSNLDRDRQLERILKENASCAHEATLHIEDRCRGRTRVHHVGGFGLLAGFHVTEANARADGKELIVGFRTLKPTRRYHGRTVVVHLEARRPNACGRLVYLFAHDLEPPPLDWRVTDLGVEVAQLEPASRSKELRIVEVFGEEGTREQRARYVSKTGRYSIYETTTSGA